jgi:uncharacterized protein YdhG (YjbR/CyaY superfamily)
VTQTTDSPSTVDEYIARQPDHVQPILIKLRQVIKDAAPHAEEKINYDMPAYYLNGFLVSFSAWKRHIGFYPRTQAMHAIPALAAYGGTKGSVHFPLNKAIPYDLISELVKARLIENLNK